MRILIDGLNYLAVGIFWLTIAVAFLFLLRVLFTLAKVNPFAKIPYHLTQFTERMVRPIRYQLGGRIFRYDFVPLIAGAIILIAGLLLASDVRRLAVILHQVNAHIFYGLVTVGFLIKVLLALLLIAFEVILSLRIFLPYFGFNYTNRFMRFAFKITEPVLKPLRRYLVLGMWDFSPFIILLISDFVIEALIRAM